MRCIKLTLAYDGTAYLGWQRQAKGKTIQGVLEEALTQITGSSCRIVASGRTDAGVHALGQVVAVWMEHHLPVSVLQKALNAVLPADIVVLAAEEMAPTFHPIRDAKRKRYRYYLWDAPTRPVFWRHYVWHFWRGLDCEKMQQGARYLIGHHDFSAFETHGAKRKSSTRTIFGLEVTRQEADLPQLIVFDVQADGFLYNMVRNIVGSLVEVGRGARPPEWIGQVLASRDRRNAGPTAPPQGLFLVSVSYDDQPSDQSSEPGDFFFGPPGAFANPDTAHPRAFGTDAGG